LLGSALSGASQTINELILFRGLQGIGVGTTTSLGVVSINMIVVGVGIGLLQPVMTLAVQNAIPIERLGVGTGAITYLRTTGSTVGTAVLATMVANVSSSQLASYLPTAARTLPSSVLALATNQQVLVDPSKQHQIVQAATQQATAKLPAGSPQVVQISAQISHLFAQIFSAGRAALADGLHQAFLISVGVCVATFLVTLFLKDVRLRTAKAPVSEALTEAAEAVTVDPLIH